jgi:hypothetical protein
MATGNPHRLAVTCTSQDASSSLRMRRRCGGKVSSLLLQAPTVSLHETSTDDVALETDDLDTLFAAAADTCYLADY